MKSIGRVSALRSVRLSPEIQAMAERLCRATGKKFNTIVGELIERAARSCPTCGRPFPPGRTDKKKGGKRG